MESSMRCVRDLLGLLILAAALAACSASTPVIQETLDPGSGVTVLRSTAPMIFFRDNSSYAAHARDYIYVGPIEVNRMGARSHYLWLGIWSTIRDDGRLADYRVGFDNVILFVDGEPFPLELAGWTLDSIGVTEPVYVKPVASAADAYYHVTLDQLRLLAVAQRIELRVGTARPRHYELWDQQGPARDALVEFGQRAYD
jgi:hypothetical protein